MADAYADKLKRLEQELERRFPTPLLLLAMDMETILGRLNVGPATCYDIGAFVYGHISAERKASHFLVKKGHPCYACERGPCIDEPGCEGPYGGDHE
jgi:hypothetical protein